MRDRNLVPTSLNAQFPSPRLSPARGEGHPSPVALFGHASRSRLSVTPHQWRLARLFLALGLTLFIGATARAGSIEKLEAFIAQTQSARASFSQQVLDKNGKSTQSASGRLMFSRPGHFRWEYQKPYEQLIVGDGEKLWVYDKELAQVTVKKLEGALGSSPAALLAGSNDMEQYYNLDAKGVKRGLDWLEAYPKEADSMFQKVRMGFKGNTLDTMELYDQLGQITVIRFSRIERNPKLHGDTFTFTAPDGVDVIEDE
jgi:outer membrane lipoprotein carrier protein